MSIVINNIDFMYRNKRALADLSCTLAPGFNVLLGPNGAGKSTLLNLLTAQRPLQRGNIHFDGVDIEKTPRQIMQQLGVVFQQTTLDLDLSVFQNLTYFGALHGIKARVVLERITPVLTQLGLIERLHDTVRDLNEGHRRRVEIARCMIHQPRYLLLDEATVGLDVDSRKLIIEHIRLLAQQQAMTILWTTHLLDEVQEDDPLYILNHGQLIAQGKCKTLLSEHQQNSVFDLYRWLTQPQGLV
ncbi:ATP-binding cassette domain-containing protein [Glaciecola sp. 33A]|jgi:ABC-2 type transport system ATP-binding protein|uniref:ATP-binding cassette domain-containing protein n=1 Tax=Glaciecola sp. 33A TaxID=2057807 RepID=UPI000C3487C3|nr:ATP-binding cassette domain-containing protein [Glaciecola sp. 33A]PKI01246.1 ABC transporter ATP-binding protein [Glaciecola sp. 33A]